MIKNIKSGDLNVAYYELGPINGTAVFLLHGFPYDIHAYKVVATILSDVGYRVVVPYLRGFGKTTFLKENKIKSGEQAALGYDLLCLMDSLEISEAILAGYDWGGRAACVVAALWPKRCLGLVSCNSYNIQNIVNSKKPILPVLEQKLWYQYYFHSERGYLGLTRNRPNLIRLLWETWSPTWNFSEETFQLSLKSFENSAFVDVVIHSYKHRFGLSKSDPKYKSIQDKLSEMPSIIVPSITLDGQDDGVRPPSDEKVDSDKFTGFRRHKILSGVGHNVPQEAPEIFANAILELYSHNQNL